MYEEYARLTTQRRLQEAAHKLRHAAALEELQRRQCRCQCHEDPAVARGQRAPRLARIVATLLRA